MKAKHYLLVMITLSIFSFAARTALPADSLVGRWKYQISDVPPEYESGYMVFEEKDSKTTGYVEGGGKTEMKNLAVDQGKVTFVTENEHGEFKYSFMQKADTLTGMISSQYGEFPIRAVKEGK